MSKSRLFMIPAVVGITVGCSLSSAGDQEAIFKDDFNRDDADAVENEWSSKGAAVLKDKAVLFNLKEEEFRPRIKHSFPVQKEGTFTVSFLMDWLRESEGTWGFYMQLGNSAEIPKSLVYERDLAKGIGVNLIWGGGELVDRQDAGSFGYLKNGEFKTLFVVNDRKVENTVVKKAVVTIDVDLDSSTYRVKFNGNTYAELPFDNKGPIDTIRFITNGCSKTGFSKSAIDDVTISKGK